MVHFKGLTGRPNVTLLSFLCDTYDSLSFNHIILSLMYMPVFAGIVRQKTLPCDNLPNERSYVPPAKYLAKFKIYMK